MEISLPMKSRQKKILTTLTEGQIDNINNELEKQRVQLSDTCRTVHYSQEGVDQLIFLSEDAKKLLFSINQEFPHNLNHPKLVAPVKKLYYAIKITLKKIRNIQEKINTDANPEASKTADTPRHRRFSQITPPEKSLGHCS